MVGSADGAADWLLHAPMRFRVRDLCLYLTTIIFMDNDGLV